MGLLDRFKKSRQDLERTQKDLTVSQQNLARAEAVLSEAQKVDKKLKDHFVGKLFRGKLIEDIHVATRADRSEFIRISGRVISIEEYLTNDYKELIKDDAWISGPFGVYGGVADRRWWKSFIGALTSEGVENNNGNVRANKSFSTYRTYKIVSGLDFTREDQQALKKILTDDLGMNEMYFFPYKIKGSVSINILEEAYDKVIEFLIKETEPLKANDKDWHYFSEEGSLDALIDKVVPVVDTIVEEIVRVKLLEK